MKYSREEVMQYVQEEDVKFIRLAFCDVFGKQKNISILPEELPRAFEYGIAFDASAIAGFGDESKCDLLLHPEPETLMLLPWSPDSAPNFSAPPALMPLVLPEELSIARPASPSVFTQ